MRLIEEVAYYRAGQFLLGYIQDPRAVENEHIVHSVFLGELNAGGRKGKKVMLRV